MTNESDYLIRLTQPWERRARVEGLRLSDLLGRRASAAAVGIRAPVQLLLARLFRPSRAGGGELRGQAEL